MALFVAPPRRLATSPEQLAELQAMDFDMNLTGFSADELIRLLQSESTQGQTDPDGAVGWGRVAQWHTLEIKPLLAGNPSILSGT
jgi:hypothetical protein